MLGRKQWLPISRLKAPGIFVYIQKHKLVNYKSNLRFKLETGELVAINAAPRVTSTQAARSKTHSRRHILTNKTVTVNCAFVKYANS